ncbi:4202_t:CDS:2 [Funneliformis mosseae]|uniref:4202_t:CDS:1 n=1 Tax=Funneliformis mosseae TaxID=27381 RepID=A0A9N9AIC7_FUNMO|nr:4202_t:CDS:2 [Funneliformis mosseae]
MLLNLKDLNTLEEEIFKDLVDVRNFKRSIQHIFKAVSRQQTSISGTAEREPEWLKLNIMMLENRPSAINVFKTPENQDRLRDQASSPRQGLEFENESGMLGLCRDQRMVSPIIFETQPPNEISYNFNANTTNKITLPADYEVQ